MNQQASVKALRADEQETNQVTVPFDTVVDYLLDQIAGEHHGDDCCDDPDHIHLH